MKPSTGCPISVCTCVVVLLLWSVAAATAAAHEKPGQAGAASSAESGLSELPPCQRMLSGEDSIRVAEVEKRVEALAILCNCADAIPLAEEVSQVRARLQGADHWQAVDARLLVETLKHIATLPPQACHDLVKAELAETTIVRLWKSGRYAEGIALCRRHLEIRTEYLGDSHRVVANSLASLGRLLERSADLASAESAQRQALSIRRKALGEEHPDIAASRNDLGVLLHRRGVYAEAELLHRDALAMKRRLLGNSHPDVAISLSNLGMLLYDIGDYESAEALQREALELKRRLRGNDHVDVALSLNNLAAVMDGRGSYASAESLYLEALAIKRKLYGDAHPHVAISLSNLAGVLQSMGDYSGAEALQRGALTIKCEVFGREHPDVALGLDKLSILLRLQGDYPGAEVLCREALAIERQLLGEVHPRVANTLGNLGVVLAWQGDASGAEQLQRQALTMKRQLLGGGHPEVALTLNNLGVLLHNRGDYAGAELLYAEALAIKRNVLGDEHPDVASGLYNLGNVLKARGEYARADTFHGEALAMRRNLLPASHPDIAASMTSIAALLHAAGDYVAAESMLSQASEVFEAARLRVSHRGMGRTEYATRHSPLIRFAGCLARNGQPSSAWLRLEGNMARGVLDELSARLSRPLEPDERQREESLIGRLDKLDERMSAILAARDSTGESRARADTLRWERDALQAELARLEADMAAKYGVAAGEVYGLERIRAYLSSGSALLVWVDVEGDPHAVDPNGEHWACVVRHEGEPVWVKLPGSGERGAWTEEDDELPGLVREALGKPPGAWGRVSSAGLVGRLHAQRVAPVEPDLEGVTHLVVLPAGWMAGVPVEVLTDRYTVSYAPSATMYTWLQEKPRAAGAETVLLLAVGDPLFEAVEAPDVVLPEPPEEGVLLAMVASESNAERSGLREGDVLLSYRGETLSGPGELGPAIEGASGDSVVGVTVWREGETVELRVSPGKLGVRPSEQPVPEALALRRRLDRVLETSRGRAFVALPWTRAEVEGIADLFGPEERASTILLGPDASERRLDELASSGELGRYRYIHLATHAVMDDEVAMRSALILSRDPVDDSFERALEGLEVYDGRLTAEQIVRTWKIDADLVTLSACETALGKESGGEGFLGFSQSLFVAGARSLVLTLWKVQDTPAMLLMRRFYENLLGRFDEPRLVAGNEYLSGSPLPKAEALREAKEWLRELTWEELREVEEELSSAWRGEELPMEMPPGLVEGECPYADPHYWAAFVLMGDPR